MQGFGDRTCHGLLLGSIFKVTGLGEQAVVREDRFHMFHQAVTARAARITVRNSDHQDSLGRKTLTSCSDLFLTIMLSGRIPRQLTLG